MTNYNWKIGETCKNKCSVDTPKYFSFLDFFCQTSDSCNGLIGPGQPIIVVTDS